MQLNHVLAFMSACLQLHNLMEQSHFRKMFCPLLLWLGAFGFNEKMELHEIEEFQTLRTECVKATRCGTKLTQSII